MVVKFGTPEYIKRRIAVDCKRAESQMTLIENPCQVVLYVPWYWTGLKKIQNVLENSVVAGVSGDVRRRWPWTRISVYFVKGFRAKGTITTTGSVTPEAFTAFREEWKKLDL